MPIVESLIEATEIETLLSLLKSCARKNMEVVEVGVYRGGTSIVLWDELRKYEGTLHCIDTWVDEEILRVFKEVLESYALDIQYHRLPSIEAAILFPDKSLDLVFLDADHRYSGIHQDILAWQSKVREGGILCGHDCEKKYTSYSETEQRDIDNNIERDETRFACHAGVIRALYDIYKDDYFLSPRIWWVKT